MLVTSFWINPSGIERQVSSISFKDNTKNAHGWSESVQGIKIRGVFVGYERIFQSYGFKKGPNIRI